MTAGLSNIILNPVAITHSSISRAPARTPRGPSATPHTNTDPLAYTHGDTRSCLYVHTYTHLCLYDACCVANVRPLYPSTNFLCRQLEAQLDAYLEICVVVLGLFLFTLTSSFSRLPYLLLSFPLRSHNVLKRVLESRSIGGLWVGVCDFGPPFHIQKRTQTRNLHRTRPE